MKTVIMAGGKGTRISSVASDIPKPMIKIEGKPVLEHEIECLRDQGYTDLIITVSHLGSIIMDYFGDGSKYGVQIQYFNEETPLGNAGALFKLRDQLEDDFLLLNADAIFDVDFNRFVDYHKRKGGIVTLFTHPNSHPYDSGVLIANENGVVETWLTKEDVRPQWYRNRVNAGLHVINPIVLDMTGIDLEIVGTIVNGKTVKVDLDRQILKPLCGTGKMFCYDSPEYVKDMGTPDRYEAVCKDFVAGRVKAKNLKQKQKAIFLDRDGAINKYVGFLRNIGDFELLPGVAEAVRKINACGYLAIVITNQPVIARGEVTREQLEEIHNKMETLLGAEGAYLDSIYYCPHHPHKGYEGEVPELKIECDCRKPKPGMLLKAAEDFNIDLANSWMIGDGENDIKAGKAAECNTALIGTEDFGQNLSAPTLLDAVGEIIKREGLTSSGQSRKESDMRTFEPRLEKHIELLISRYPALKAVKQDIIDAYLIMDECYEHDGKLLIAGNGGSAADSEHIAGELMKRFKTPRPVTAEFAEKLKAIDSERGENLAKNLERGLMAIPLVAHEALTTAYINDVDGLGVFAQQLFGFGRPGDVFLGISTSGNSKNVMSATVVARALGIKVIGLTGSKGGELATVADVCVKAPSEETYMIQEYHLPIYHCWCLMLEDKFFGN